MLLTERERAIVRHVKEDATNREIARVLGISEAAVNRHLTRIFQKLGIKTRFQAKSMNIDE
jgi:DNA-binding CsgD family transcriptional regulator